MAAGAKEIDIVITRAHVLTGNYEALFDEVKRFREACGDAHMKAILAITQLTTEGTKKTAASAAKLTALATGLKSSVAGFKLA